MPSRIGLIAVTVAAVAAIVVAGLLVLGPDDEVVVPQTAVDSQPTFPLGSDIYKQQIFSGMYDSCMTVAIRTASDKTGNATLSDPLTEKLVAYCKCATDSARDNLTQADLIAFAGDQSAEPAASVLQTTIAECTAKWLK